MQNVAVVKIEMASKFVTRAVRDQRVTFVDQLSSLGALGINVIIAIFGNFLVCMYIRAVSGLNNEGSGRARVLYFGLGFLRA
jgi:hypothetical protein